MFATNRILHAIFVDFISQVRADRTVFRRSVQHERLGSLQSIRAPQERSLFWLGHACILSHFPPSIYRFIAVLRIYRSICLRHRSALNLAALRLAKGAVMLGGHSLDLCVALYDLG